ncbi:MAG TPA: TPM domain-containing protein [Dongiaceae bacterium]|nr:TPM domain-containing protein [Dongiaceae bacterium]
MKLETVPFIKRGCTGLLVQVRILLWMLLLFLPQSALHAETGWVRDGADVLSPEVEARLDVLLENVKQQTTAEVMVITVPSLNGDYLDYFATQLFNQIGIGRSETNNGVLFLIAPNERRTRIEVGYGLEPLLTDDLAGQILDAHVIPQFRSNDIQAGIVAGTEEIARLLQRYPDAARGIPGSTPLYVRTTRSDLNIALFAVFALAITLFVLYFIMKRKKHFPALVLYLMLALATGSVVLTVLAFVAMGRLDALPQTIIAGGLLLISLFMQQRLYRRYGPHPCEFCSGPSRLLSEAEDDHHLNQVQRLEEKLGSVDYDVWYCPACLKGDTERYIARFSGFADCPNCSARTLKETTTILVPATRSHGGENRVDGVCQSCSHKTSRIEHTARISDSSSSGGSGGGSSGGGGRSGGGGASRSW